jgi:hypothetical protein
MRAFISAVLTAVALTFSATAAMVFDADLESLLAGFKRTSRPATATAAAANNKPGISKSFRQIPSAIPAPSARVEIAFATINGKKAGEPGTYPRGSVR